VWTGLNVPQLLAGLRALGPIVTELWLTVQADRDEALEAGLSKCLSLRTMVVRVQTAAVLSRLTCPHLERLHIKVSFSSMLIFSGASLPSLRTLCLTDVTLVECSLEALPSLRSLSLMFCATFARPLGLESLFVQGDRRLSLDAIVRVSATLEKNTVRERRPGRSWLPPSSVQVVPQTAFSPGLRLEAGV
jgi:hypothetical protein